MSCGTARVINENRTATFYDKNVSTENVLFFNQVKRNHLPQLSCITAIQAESFYIAPPVEVLVRGSVIVPDQDTDVIRFEGTLNWNDWMSQP